MVLFMNMKSKKKVLTEEQKKECFALRDIFLSKQNELKLNQRKVADILGITPPSLSNYLNGINALNVKIAVALSDILKINVSDFSPRLAEEISKIAQVATSDNNISSTSNEHNNIKHIESYSQLAKTFSYPLLNWNDIEIFIDKRLSSNNFRGQVMSVKNIKEGFSIEVLGDSMGSSGLITFPAGTKLIIDPYFKKLEPEKFYIVKLPDGTKTFKQLIRDAGLSYLKSLNDNYKPIPINEAECEFLGLVVDRDLGNLY